MATRPTSSTGHVFRAVNPQSAEHPQAAVKVVSYASTTHRQPVDRRALQKEVQIHSILKHRNVLEFLGSVEYTASSAAPSNYVRGLYILLELGAGGDLFDKIAPDVGVDEDLAHFYFTQLVSGLGVTHRDIKPENMLLDAQGNLKIADFGLCSVYKYKGKERTLHGTCGSLPYIAPEMNGQPYHGEPVDVWSSGVVLFALLVGTLLRRMMHPDPKRRSSLEQIQRHRWFTRPNALLTSGKCNDPVSLAERLLQGLIVSGDVQLALHSDGQRAPVPEKYVARSHSVSLSQPEAMQSRSLGLGRDDAMPSSTAQPALHPRRGLAASQFARPSATQLEDHAAEFTQALGYLSSAVPYGTAMAVHLTRFYSGDEPPHVATALTAALERQKAQFSVEPLGQDTELQEAYEDMELGTDGETRPSQPLAGARGVRIRLGLVDRRKCALKGEIRIERLAELPPELAHAAKGTAPSFVLMRRSKGNPLEWRRLFRNVCADAGVRELIARPAT
ncbi:chk1 [Malassezia furfur]|nr:chk1 [Malassezia furfur]